MAVDWVILDTASSALFKELTKGKLPKKSPDELARNEDFRANISSARFGEVCGRKDEADEKASIIAEDFIPDVVARHGFPHSGIRHFSSVRLRSVLRDRSVVRSGVYFGTEICYGSEPFSATSEPVRFGSGVYFGAEVEIIAVFRSTETHV